VSPERRVLHAAAVVAIAVSLVSGADAGPEVAGPGGLIVFASDRGGNFDLYAIRPDGRELRRLTRTQAMEACPSLSPDGRWIAFTRYRGTFGELFVARHDGTGVRRVLAASYRIQVDSCPTWSPDGKALAFKRWAYGDTTGRIDDIFVTRLDGTGVRRVTTDNSARGGPAWSRTGLIAWTTMWGSSGGFGDVWTVRPDGSEARAVTSDGSARSPSWAPDGTRIAYVADNPDQPLDAELFTVAPDGSDRRRITNLEKWPHAPAWSPDGRWIVFLYGWVEEGNTDLYLLNLATGQTRPLTRASGFDGTPSWGIRR
jgi:Tol biopolymer transport system component